MFFREKADYTPFVIINCLFPEMFLVHNAIYRAILPCETTLARWGQCTYAKPLIIKVSVHWISDSVTR
jgi:hypothetical protein